MLQLVVAVMIPDEAKFQGVWVICRVPDCLRDLAALAGLQVAEGVCVGECGSVGT